jgi:integrative and conjugative element protein (TIGR02256 family)
VTNPELLVHGEVLDRLARVPGRPWEVGGWLLGWWSDDGCELFVTHATPPASRGTPFGVTISGRGHRPLFDAAWDASGGTVTFLGDWHTHPGGPAALSERDRKAMRQLSSDPDFGTSQPLIAIVATSRWPWSRTEPTIRFYVGTSDEPREFGPNRVDRLPPIAACVPDWRW